MGLCFSRKESPSPPPDPIPKCIPNEKNVEEKKEKQGAAAAQPVAEVATEKKQDVGITQTPKKTPAAEEKDKIKKAETPTKKSRKRGESSGSGGDRSPLGAVRTSSCTKEEVDAILIQCGRLSRSSSGKASTESGGGHRKYSGSKRSYDFDNEKKGEEEEEEEEEEWEKPISRPSPRRRTPGRERSGSRERSSGGGRRVSRSPGRRSEGPTSSSSAGDNSKKPAKMVSVPAREKGGGLVTEAGGVGARRVSSAAASKRAGEARGLRSASPRSRSPANTTRTATENAVHHNPQPSQPQSLSRNSSRKAERSPYRRNPMAELDENSLRGNQNGSNNCKAQKIKEGEEGLRKPSQSQTQKASENIANLRKSEQRNGGAVEVKGTNVITNFVREQPMNRRAKEQQMEPEIGEGALQVKGASKDGEAHLTSNGVESSLNPRTITRTRSSRRSSRDFDHALDLNPDNHLIPTSYTSLLLEDIHNYHQKNTAFSLPACVSKACSILEAVADLKSSCSENKSSDADRSNNDDGSLDGRFGRRGLVPKGPFVESEIVVKDDLMEPSLHKYVSVRDLGGGEMEPQESAGSNSFIGQPWSSPWEPNSGDSTDRYWTSQSINGDEVEQQQQQQQSTREVARNSEARGRRLRDGSTTNSLPTTMSSGSKKRELDHHRALHRGGSGFGGGSGKAAAASS
ncbi:eukaryotic translation initiation factor 4B3 [Phoenix dactylifera]|uniref:Eukaryotic translation initiation factor 4B3 n=1 Tax=Phoenix dactylifera TaxID=42345 RepID=A0A8B7CUF8_PHODC|nr:eukaryotic translation initiation factor 4B3 [Phoenix dactylifera]